MKKLLDRVTGNFLILIVVVLVSIFAIRNGNIPLLLLSWVVFVPFGHAQLMAFHEATHSTLGPTPFWNKVRGFIMGFLIFTPVNAYRIVHSLHHVHLGRAEDLEMWPYNCKEATRFFRVSFMLIELLLGYPASVFIMLRGVVVAKSNTNKSRVIFEYLVMWSLWLGIFYAVHNGGYWKELIWGYLVPANIVGFFQTLRKYCEHLGMFGETPLSMTRTIIPQHWFEKLICWINLDEAQHGTHHDDPTASMANMYAKSREMLRKNPTIRPYYSYFIALKEIFYCLGDPKLGSTWQ